MRARTLPIAGALALAVTPLLAAAGSARAAAAIAPAQVRVNQVGYPAGGAKVAYAMLPARVGSVSFTVTGREGVVFRGRSATDAGYWNKRYHAVYRLTFTALRRPGDYRIVISSGGQPAVSPWFSVGGSAAQYGRLVRNAVRYFTSERDGADVEPAVLNRLRPT